ncbi:MAG TPA: ABC transporter ATP-binding protein [Frankiaceae bacterium]|nr:ABC transporter ATP-binding protein [Frankiaceae bacterium]
MSSISASPVQGQALAVKAIDLSKDYGSGEARVSALRQVNVGFPAGVFSAIMGPSGSGKSTLMHCLAGLDSVTSGEVWLGGGSPGEKPVLLSTLSDRKLTQVRRDRVGFIFQQFNLLPTLTAAENIRLPLDIAGRKVDKAWFDRVVKTLGLEDRLTHRPTEMSGGQIQRVACARAIVSRPAVIFADEPTGNLDSHASAEVLGFLRQSVQELGQTVIMVTHDPTAASFSDQVVFLSDGQLVDGMSEPTADRVLDRMKSLDTSGAAGAPQGRR